MILGTGLDIVEIDRIARLFERHGDRAVRLLLTAEEARRVPDGAGRAAHLAGRFAAKEAVMKALGTGWAGGVSFRQITITNDAAGRPTVALSGAAASRCQALGGHTWHVSISHGRDYAVAHAILEGGEERPV